MRVLQIYSPLLFLGLIAFWGCSSTKPELPVVTSFDLQKYTGLWYEILRLPNSFESGLNCTTARYSFKENGDIEVVNSGHKITDPSVVKTSTGTAWVPNINEPAKLKVRFFWPFSGNYWIIALDPDYRYVMIGEPSREYLWILSREKTINEETITTLLSQAKSQGFDISKLERISQICSN
ncbi:MAG: lipocalin family protein [bacterium]